MIVKTYSEVYLDANATTRVLPEAAEAARDVMEQLFGNPSSSHIAGLRARKILESTRELARQVLGAKEGEVIFTSGATEAIQMAVLSAICHAKESCQQRSVTTSDRVLLYGATEHKAVPQAIMHWNKLLDFHAQVLEIPVDENGMLDTDFIREHSGKAELICTMAVNNETGVVSDLDAIESSFRPDNPSCIWLVDCVQAVGKTSLQLSDTTIDYAVASGHKIFAPKGIGLLYLRNQAPVVPLLAGGGQEHGRRGGTENLSGVAAIGAVLQRLVDSPTRSFAAEDRLVEFRSQLIDALQAAFPKVAFNTPLDKSVPCTINFSVPDFSSKELMDLFDAAGVRVSSGSACGSAAVNSYVLDAMGVEDWRSKGAIRLSFSAVATSHEIEAAADRIREVGRALNDSCLVVADDAEGLVQSGQDLDGLIQLRSGSDCSYLIMNSETRRCIVIDPFEALSQRIETLIRCQKSQVVAVLDTHAHVDHDSIRQDLLGALSQFAIESARTNDLLGWPEVDDGECILGDGSTARMIRLSPDFVVAKTNLPGHTRIGVAYFYGTLEDKNLLPENIEIAFLGDTILMGGIGRTDFPCSCIDSMYDSLKRLPDIILPTTVICPTHDYNLEFATTLETELEGNGFLRSILSSGSLLSKKSFKEQKPEIDAGIKDASNSELVCGFIRHNDTTTKLYIDNSELKSLITDGNNHLIIDVREPHEFSFEQSWDELGFSEAPVNVPLTRFSGFLPELLNYKFTPQQKVIFLCRSGKRSSIAAEITRRLGFDNARCIVGGLALNTRNCGPQLKQELDYMI
ncbi:MAG: aminotransferase class V-fold PLP-dependent enzyme [Planctomycetota bacterium]